MKGSLQTILDTIPTIVRSFKALRKNVASIVISTDRQTDIHSEAFKSFSVYRRRQKGLVSFEELLNESILKIINYFYKSSVDG